MKIYHMTYDSDRRPISGSTPTDIVRALKMQWSSGLTNRQYMKAFKERAIALKATDAHTIRINSAKNFIEDLERIGILTPVEV